jgi:cytochrome c biogenesis protein CcmG/thiol:disulfide interchange protein DsbE
VPRRPLAAAIVLVGLLSACSSGGDSLSFVRLSGPLPSFSGATLGGGSFGPTDYAGRVLVVNFWNYDCPPCRQEQPVLQAAWTALRGKGVSFVGVMFVGGVPAWPDDRIAARAYLQTYGVTYPAIVDEGSSIAERFAIQGIPTTVIADRTGHLRFRILGMARPGQIQQLVSELG